MDQAKRLEWAADIIEIQQLAFRYAISADSKDPQRMASLFVERIGADGQKVTRAMLAERYAKSFARSPLSILSVSNHAVELVCGDPDRATGTVYCRCETEFEGHWLIQQIVYLDEYVREDGAWHFLTRKHLLFYGAYLGENPIGLPPSDAAELTDGKGSIPQAWPSYRAFWETHPGQKHY
jgi:SnoaL-like domain